ncbi:PREDICTED: unnamed product, partial [Prunus dulcis]
NKWRKLNTTEKATYGSALEGSSGQVNDSVNEMSCITRCSPDRFHRTVEKLSNEKRLAIKAIGFGNVSSLSCTRLHRQLCHFLIQKFNPDTSSIELHGNVIRISADEFGRVMGLKNTGEDVQLDRPVEDEKVKQLVKSFGGNGKRVLVKGLAEQLEKCKNANEDFQVRFVMFALGTILCPTSSLSVTGKYLTFLTIPGKIETKNWADHGFNFLCEGVRSFKAKKVAYVNGSLLFLQLLYFDSIVHGGVYVDKWLIKQGGFDSPTVRVVSQHRRTNEVSGVNVERIVQEVSISLAP